MARILTEDDFDSVVLNSDRPVLVDFYANWCGPCAMLSHIIDELDDWEASFAVYKVDVDKSQNLAYEYKVRSVPTLLKFENGIAVNRKVGYSTRQEIEDFMGKQES